MKNPFILIVGILSLGVFCTCQNKIKDELNNNEISEGILPIKDRMVEVTIAQVQKKIFVQEIEINGIIQAIQAADIVWETEGIISDVQVKVGQWVEKSQILAFLEREKEELNLEKANVDLKEKQISYQSGILGSDSTRRIYLKYTSGLAAAEVALAEAKLNSDNTVLRAPISGIISDLNLRKGSKVLKGSIFSYIWNPKSLELVGNILETQLLHLKLGQKAVIKPLGSTDVFDAVLEEINPRVNQDGLVQIKLVITSKGLLPGKSLLPGQHAKGYIQIPRNNTIVIPKEAVVMHSGRPVVFTLEKDRAKWKYVELGEENANEFEVLKGLLPEEQIIISNNLHIGHDIKVKVLPK